MKTPNQALADRLPLAIERSGRSRAAIARISGYNDSYIRKVIRKESPNPSIVFVWCIAQATNVNPAWLLGWDQ